MAVAFSQAGLGALWMVNRVQTVALRRSVRDPGTLPPADLSEVPAGGTLGRLIVPDRPGLGGDIREDVAATMPPDPPLSLQRFVREPFFPYL